MMLPPSLYHGMGDTWQQEGNHVVLSHTEVMKQVGGLVDVGHEITVGGLHGLIVKVA